MAVRDSKKLSPLQRERALATLRQHAIDIVTGEATWEEIDDIGLTRATHLALSRAIERLKVQPDFYLLDQMPLPNLPCKAVKKGDDLCYSIAAASIAAKVTRDHRMVEMETHFPGYGFARHKGYPSAKHMEALWRLGPSPIHRRSFAPVKRCLEAMSG
jgi:ribonuclease HII